VVTWRDMTLRSKMLLVTGLVCGALLVLAAIIIWQLSLASYSQLERQAIERDLALAKNALQNSLEQLENGAFGYSYWEDTQAFVRGEYPEYLPENDLLNNPPPATDIDVMILSNTLSDIAFAKAYTSAGGEAIQSEIVDELRPYLTRSEDDATVSSGALLVGGQPALVVVSPLLDSAGQLPATGTMIVVNYLNQESLTELAKTTGTPLTLHLLEDASSEDIQIARAQWQRDPSQFVIRTTPDLIRGYLLVPNILGQPLFAWGVEAERTIYQQGLKNVLVLIMTLFAVGVVAVIAVAVLLERTVLKRLSELSKSVRAISESGDITARTTLEGKDELALLSKDINRMLASLEHQEEALRQSNKELEQFAYIASHDLQEPLRKVQAFSDRLASKYAHQLDDDGKLYISRMQDASNRMRTLIQDLLSYSRIRSKGQEFVSVDLNEIVRGVISDLEVRLEQTEGRVKVGELPTVLADPLQMRQVFQNLIGNALKFKKSGVPPVVQVAAKLGKNGHTIVVQDNGIGFEQQYAERVFEIFQRLHGRSEYEGTGMGLAIVKKILERHVGSIRAESEKGKGTRFILTLPNHTSSMLNKTLIEDLPREDKPKQTLATEMEKEFA
jgi:signal transduction histidine kinase